MDVEWKGTGGNLGQIGGVAIERREISSVPPACVPRGTPLRFFSGPFPSHHGGGEGGRGSFSSKGKARSLGCTEIIAKNKASWLAKRMGA